MRPADLVRLAHAALVECALPTMRYQRSGRFLQQEGVSLRRQDLTGPHFNYAAALGPAPPLGRILELADAFFAGAPGGYGVLVEADAGHPVEAELRSRGWAVVEDEPAFVMPELPAAAPAPAGLEVRRVADAAGRRDYGATVEGVFGSMGDGMDSLIPAAGLADAELAFLVGYCGGEPVSAATALRAGPAVHVAGVATLETYRGRGYGAALTRAALAEGARWGCTHGALRSGPLSVPLYRRLGFIHVCNHRTYAVPA
jgi:GNAT superfamily N-acetyltransferase